VYPPLPIARDQAEERAEERANGYRREAHNQGDTRAIHNAAQHIAPQRIRAKQELGIGRLQTDRETALVEIELIGIVRGQYWRQEGDHHKPTQDQRTRRPEWLAADEDGEGPPYALAKLHRHVQP